MTEAAPSPGLTRKKKLLLGLATALAPFLLLEIFLQILSPSYPVRVRAPAAHAQVRAYLGRGELWSDEDMVELGFSIYEDDRRLLWRMKPCLDTELANFLTPAPYRENTRFRVVTAGRGFRSVPDAKAPEGPLRVACLGDSHTFGWGIAAHLAYPAALEGELTRQGVQALVLNRGQPGYSTAQGRILLQEVLDQDRPRVVILAFGFNDSRRSDVADRDLMQGRASLGGTVRWAAGRLQVVRLVQSMLPPRSAGPPESGAQSRVSRAAFMANLAAMARTCQERSVSVVFLSLFAGPAMEGDTAVVAADHDAPHLRGSALAAACAARVADRRDPEAAQAANRAVATFSEPFLAENPQYWIRVDAAHYGAYVHHAVARALASVVAALLKNRAGR